MTSANDIQERLQAHLAGEIACEPVEGGSSRIGCLTPLEYPSGEGITVWVEQFSDRLEVTDYGESLTDALGRPPQDRKALYEQIEAICAPLGLKFAAGRMATDTTLNEVGDAMWRVASAALLVAQLSETFSPHRRHQTPNPFVVEVEHDLQGRNLQIERGRKLEGASGHKHTATIFLPHSEAILEPIGFAGNWNQVSTVYTKFGDLSHVNGYKRYSLVDDREGQLDEGLASMLVQVSSLVKWTSRDIWLDSVS